MPRKEIKVNITISENATEEDIKALFSNSLGVLDSVSKNVRTYPLSVINNAELLHTDAFFDGKEIRDVVVRIRKEEKENKEDEVVRDLRENDNHQLSEILKLKNQMHSSVMDHEERIKMLEAETKCLLNVCEILKSKV